MCCDLGLLQASGLASNFPSFELLLQFVSRMNENCGKLAYGSKMALFCAYILQELPTAMKV